MSLEGEESWSGGPAREEALSGGQEPGQGAGRQAQQGAVGWAAVALLPLLPPACAVPGDGVPFVPLCVCVSTRVHTQRWRVGAHVFFSQWEPNEAPPRWAPPGRTGTSSPSTELPREHRGPESPGQEEEGRWPGPCPPPPHALPWACPL